jgi:hypothetical protein
MTSTTATLAQWLTDLLAERHQLRQRLIELRRAKMLAYPDEAAVTEAKIRDLVVGPLALSKLDTPNAFILAQAVAALIDRSSRIDEIGNPALAFNTYLVCGLPTNYVPALQARLVDLCSPLDATIAARLAADD